MLNSFIKKDRVLRIIEDAIVSSTNVAMAAKDSSTLWINSLTTNNTKGYCLEAYSLLVLC